MTLQKQQWLCKLVWLKLSSPLSLAWGYPVYSVVFYSTKTVCSNKWELSFRSILPGGISLSVSPLYISSVFKTKMICKYSTCSNLPFGHSASAAPTPSQIRFCWSAVSQAIQYDRGIVNFPSPCWGPGKPPQHESRLKLGPCYLMLLFRTGYLKAQSHKTH